MIQGKLLSIKDDLHEVYDIRRRVFVEELGMTQEAEFDESDKDAIHVLVYKEEKTLDSETIKLNSSTVATGCILYDGSNCIIRNVAVLTEYRGQGYGDFTVKMLLNRAFTSCIHEVTVDATQSTVGFFEKVGFHVVERDENYVKMIIGVNDLNKCCKK